MRILHTSDWHLGRSFHREGMLPHQAAFVDHLLDVVESEKVDVVLVAGDVYDRALPPVDAVALADEAFGRLAASRARVIVTSGNHDSAIRLGFNAGLADAAGVHFRTKADRLDDPILIEDRHGAVAFYGLPYLEPQILHERWELTERTHAAVLGEAMRRVRGDLAGRGARSVVLAHAFVGGKGADPDTMRSHSERDISVGGVQLVPVDTFDGVSYAALGHLHGRHTLTEAVRYSGSPLAYSFSEAAHVKGSWLVELDADGFAEADFVAAPVPRALALLRGHLDDLLHDPALVGAEGAWVSAVITDPVRPMAAMERLRTRFPHTLQLAHEPEGADAPRADARTRLATKSDHEITLTFVEHVRGESADEVESALLSEACDACRLDATPEATA